jgi:two-component system NtrC family sensor kinase
VALRLVAAGMRAQVAGEATRLRKSKVEAMAEFAAGAGHEVNNPLAVISGQAQYLLGHQADWFREDAQGQAHHALHTIIAQTRRIHSLLRDLMLFARPAPPRPARLDLPTLLGEAAAAVAELASQRQVRIEPIAGPERLPVVADADQVKMAIGCLLRNAVEAVPPEGWVRLALVEPVADDWLEVAVEDSGPGPDPAQVPSLFDPLFSGRSAGRGKGLGLPIAWRLARQHGGDVRLERMPPAGPTRFVLRLARTAAPEMSVAALAPEALSLPSSPDRSSVKMQVNGRIAS